MPASPKWVVVIAVLIMIATVAYFVGRNSSRETPTVSASPTSSVSQQGSPTANENVMSGSADDLNCKTIANDGANLLQASTAQKVSVIRSHYSTSLNHCYYMTMLVGSNGTFETDIQMAPGDTLIADCALLSSGKISCSEKNSGSITQQQFQQLQATYMTN
jgi:hypothetical protein